MSRDELTRQLSLTEQPKAVICPLFEEPILSESTCENCSTWHLCGTLTYSK